MPCAKMVKHELGSLPYIGSKLWNSIPSHKKDIESVNEFKLAIKIWKPDFSRLPYVVHLFYLV